MKGLMKLPILQHPAPEKTFKVEVYASDVGVGVVLSRRVGEKEKLHQIVFFPRKLSSTEKKQSNWH